MAEQNSATKLKEARGARKTAKAELEAAQKKLKGIEKTLRALVGERRRARKQRQENEAALQRLDEQLREKRREEDAISPQIQRQNESTDRIRGAAGRRDERVQAESKLAALITQLDQLQNKIAGLEILRRQARDKRTELDVRLQELDGQVGEKTKERRSTNNEIERKKQYLDKVLRPAVVDAVHDVRVEEVRTPLTELKDWIKKQEYLLQVFGGAGLVYAYTLMAGLFHEYWLYHSNGLRAADYTVLSDFVLVWPVLWGVLLTPAVIFLVRRLLSIPRVSEYMARVLNLLIKSPVQRWVTLGLGMVGLSLIGPGAVGFWKYYLSDSVLVRSILLGVLLILVAVCLAHRLFAIPSVSKRIGRVPNRFVGRPVWRRSVIGLGVVGLSLIGPSAAGYWTYTGVLPILRNNEDRVTVLTDPPLQHAEKFVLVGSNSNYMFFKNAGGGSPSVKAIPITSIICVGKDGCVAEATESPDPHPVLLNLEISESSGTLSALLETVRGTMEAVQNIARWRDSDDAMTPFEEAVVDELGEIGVKIGALTPSGPAGYSDYIAERLLPQFISEQMQCEKGTNPIISDLIRFVNDQPNPRCPKCPSVADPSAGSTDDNTRYEAMKALYQEKIGPKVQDIVKEFMNKSATRWTVFGFASPDGEEVENDSLSKYRAWVVIDEMCRLQGNGTLDPAINCGKKEERYADTQVGYFGEWHPINGISNSRSAVIAACVGEDERVVPQDPPRRPVEVGSNNGEERISARQTGDIPAAAR